MACMWLPIALSTLMYHERYTYMPVPTSLPRCEATYLAPSCLTIHCIKCHLSCCTYNEGSVRKAGLSTVRSIPSIHVGEDASSCQRKSRSKCCVVIRPFGIARQSIMKRAEVFLNPPNLHKLSLMDSVGVFCDGALFS